MAKWWSHSYLFRQNLTFSNPDQTIEEGKLLRFQLPKELVETEKVSIGFTDLSDPLGLLEGAWDVTEQNFAIVFQYRNITKSIPCYLEHNIDPDLDYFNVYFPAFRDISPNEETSDYWFYYGGIGELAVENLETFPEEALNSITQMSSDEFSYSGLENQWQFVDNSEGIFSATSVIGSRFIINKYTSEINVVLLSTPKTSFIRYKLDEEDWISLNTVNQDGSYGEITLSLTELNSDRHVLIIEFSGINSSDDLLLGEVMEIETEPAEVAEFMESINEDSVAVIKRVNYQNYNKLSLSKEEVDSALPWTSNIGGVISVGG